jgi:hypothetical protein
MFIVCVLAVVTTRTLVYVRELQDSAAMRWKCVSVWRDSVERTISLYVDGHRRLDILACRNDRMLPRTHCAEDYTEAGELL